MTDDRSTMQQRDLSRGLIITLSVRQINNYTITQLHDSTIQQLTITQ